MDQCSLFELKQQVAPIAISLFLPQNNDQIDAAAGRDDQ